MFDASMIGWFVATFAMLVAAGVGVPIPEELPVVGAGVWVGSNPEVGPFRWLILPVCILGVVISVEDLSASIPEVVPALRRQD